jgi:myosin heavy subunit
MADAAKPNEGSPEKPETPATPAPGATPTSPATPPEPTAEKKVEFTPEQQKELDRILAERLKREKEKTERAEAKAKQEAEEAALKDKQAFEELANKRQARITELESRVGEMDATRQKLADYEKTFTDILKAEKDGLDASIVALLDKLDPLEQLKWLSENKGKAKPAPKSPVPPTPPPSDGKPAADADIAKRRESFGKTVQSFF